MGLNAILHMTAQFLSWQCNVEKCYYKNDTICSGLDLRQVYKNSYVHITITYN